MSSLDFQFSPNFHRFSSQKLAFSFVSPSIQIAAISLLFSLFTRKNFLHVFRNFIQQIDFPAAPAPPFFKVNFSLAIESFRTEFQHEPIEETLSDKLILFSCVLTTIFSLFFTLFCTILNCPLNQPFWIFSTLVLLTLVYRSKVMAAIWCFREWNIGRL